MKKSVSDTARREHQSRRSILKAAGAGVTTASLAGCLGGVTGGGTDTITIGGTVPLSGPYGYIGEGEREAIELAVQHANEEGDAGDREVEAAFKDTETDPSAARRRAQEHINDGVDFLIGSLSSAVSLAIGELSERENIIYQGFAGSNTATGSQCQRTYFVISNSATQQTTGGLGHPLREGLGESVYEISADYAWGQSIQEYDEQVLAPEFGADYVGNIFLPLGTKDYSAALTEAMESGADILNANFAFSDQVAISNQAHEFDLLDEMIFTAPAVGVPIAEQIPWDFISSDRYFGSLPWWWDMNQTSRDVFADPYFEEFGSRPFSFSAHAYAATRTTLRAIDAAGTTEADDLVAQLEGMEIFPQLWESNERFRACDHRGTTATTTGQGVKTDERPEDQNYFNIVYKPDDVEAEQMRPCGETGCDGPFG